MESYDEFITKQTNRIRSNITETPELTTHQQSTTIRFHGFSILPPVLNKEQKEEIQRLREAAANLPNNRKPSFSSRISHVQAILDSVQLRRAPTINDFKDETGPTTTPNTACQSITLSSGLKNMCDDITENQWNLSSSPTLQILGEKVPIMSSHPLTSTACEVHAGSSLKLFKGEDLLESSCTTVLFEGVPVLGHRVERDADVNTSYRADFLLSHSEKHTHFDVSHQALSSGYVTNETSDAISSLAEETEKFTEGTEGEPSEVGDFVLNTLNLRNKSEIISHTPIDGEVLEEEYAVSTQVPHKVTEPLNPVEPDSTDGPYRTSLQNLLKKSQEHRRRQRLLRNQAKALKATEPGCAGERSLSDKENELILPGTTELRKIKEKTMDQETCTSVVERGSIEPLEVVSLAEQTRTTKSDVSLNIISSTKKSNTSSGKALSSFVNHPNKAGSPARPSTAPVPTTAKSLYQSKGKKTGSLLPKPCLTGNKKFKNVPTPKFCLSPVRSKKGSAIPGPVNKLLAKTSLPLNNETVPNPLVHAKCETVTSAGTEVGASFCRSMDQAEQITQLELNLSSLKVLISDLESTITESQAHNPTESANNSQLAEQSIISLPASDRKSPCAVPFSELVQQEVLTKDYGIQIKQHELGQCVTSLVQKMRMTEAFPAINSLKQRTAVFSDGYKQPEEWKNASGEKNKESENTEESLNGSSLNRSYDVDTPSGLWSQAGTVGKQLTPELGGQEGVSRAKRRLLMNITDGKTPVQWGEEKQPQSSTPRAMQKPVHEEQQSDEHEAQGMALMEEQRRQQQELLQSLATKYQFLRSVSFPCSRAGLRLEDMATSSLCPSSVSMGLGSSSHLPEFTLAELSSLSDSFHILQSRGSLPACHLPLVAAAVKGYLTRRLLRTDRVVQLIRTIKDTRLFLQGFQPPTPGREYSSRQDQALQERVSLQLRSARFELHDLFFSVTPAERMQVISWDRQLARERELRQKESKELQGRRKSSLSAATRKALERKRTVMLQKKAAEKTKLAVGVEKEWTFVPNPKRVPKKTTPLRRR
ncbi:centriolar coiled-coil protein of 110 kDa isoform X2 [Trichomycterus rosablanca]|uniref:centriolar coiled-coil protein of 110 kDa isoform X2 n=1 Tax=Trichomycterus rosablanca TaxID=2290929 RepID=UPI002F35F842